MVLTHAEKANVEAAIHRIREQLEAQAFRFGDASLRVTASFGVSGFQTGSPPDFAVLVNQADVALYSAKHRGRNRIEFAVA